MAYESFIGLRYLKAKRRKSVLSIITIISIAGVALGVTALIVVLSVMGGFKKDLMQKILGTKAHIIVRHLDDSPVHHSVDMAHSLARKNHIIGASPFVEAEAMISSPTNISGIVLRGIDVNLVTHVTKLDQDMQRGTLDNLVHPKKLLDELEQKHNDELLELRRALRPNEKDDSDDKSRTPNNDLNGDETTNLNDTSDNLDPILGIVDSDEMPPLPNQEESPKLHKNQELRHPDKPSSIAQTLPLNAPTDVDAIIADIPEDDAMPPLIPSNNDLDANAADQNTPSTAGKSRSSNQLPTIIIGAELAKNLKVDLGDEVNIVTPNGGMGPVGPIPKSRPFVIGGVFFTGMYEFDSNYAYTSLDNAKDFVGRDGADGLELKTDNVERSTEIAKQLRHDLGPQFRVMDWEELNKSLFFALKIEKLAMFVVLTFIILVASFSIVAMLIMIVIEKGREIAILKSMGMTNFGVMRIFIFQGSLIGIVGSAIGSIAGLAICLFLRYVGIGLDSEVYYIATLPVEMNPIEITIVILSALGISVLATLYPAYQASILTPVQGLRYD